jgi:transmembrane sensor
MIPAGIDPLVDFLEIYKSNTQLKFEANARDLNWRSIENKVEETDKGALIYKLSPIVLKVAAVILISALTVLLYFTYQAPSPELIGESFNERLVIELADGSAVTLRPNSRLYLLEDSYEKLQFEIVGEGYFDVIRNEMREFTVQAGDARVDVLGTRFTVSDWGDAVRVFLEKGLISFSRLDMSQSVNLIPGQYSTLIGGSIQEPEIAEEKSYTGWLVDEIILDSRTLSDIADEVSHHFNVRLIIPDELRSERLSGHLSLDNLGLLLEDLGRSLEGTFRETEPDVYRLETTGL